MFGFATAPAKAWYYILARCNLDGVTGADDKDGWFFISSVDGTLQKLNPAK